MPPDAIAAGPWRRAWRRFRGDGVAVAALVALGAIYLAAILAPALTRYDPIAIPANAQAAAPSAAHLFGTDFAGRDVLSRVLFGARISLAVALLATMCSAVLGGGWGALAGYAGRRTDTILMRIVDAALAMPRVVVLIAVGTFWGAVSPIGLALMIGLTGWFTTSRLVRAAVLSLREQELVVAARALGATRGRILARYILPNVLSLIVVTATLGIADVIMIEAGLGFLGIGVPPPAPSWGAIIRDGFDQLPSQWWMVLLPGLVIVLTVMAFNVVGDGLRDALDPRQLDR